MAGAESDGWQRTNKNSTIRQAGGLQPIQTALNIWIDTHGVYVATYIAQYVLFT